MLALLKEALMILLCRFAGRLATAAFALSLVFLACATAFSQQMDPNLYSDMRWRMIGPFRGGRVLAVAGIPGNPSVYYFAANGGGLWKSTDGGTVWKPIFDSAPVQSIGALALAPSNPEIIYVGSGENSLHSQVSYGNGVYKSTDGGATWQHVGLDDSHHIGKIIVDPRNPDVVLVAAMGHAYASNAERGVFRSTDGGRTWKKVLYKDDVTGAVELCFDPGNSRVVYAVLWHGMRKPGQHGASSGPGSGIYKSTDGGVNWTQLTGHGLPAGDWGRSGIVVAPGNHGRRVYAIIEAKEGGLYRSDDAGANWERATTDPRIQGSWFFGQVFVDPVNPDIVYLPETSIYRSTDGGHTFTSIKGAPGGDDYHVVWIDPQNTQRMILGCDQGASVSLDGGQTWSSWYNQPTAQFYHLATDHRYPYTVYGAQQDSGTAATLSRGDYGQITEREWSQVGPGESGYTLPDPSNPDIVFNAGPGGDVVRIFRRTGQVQNISPSPISLGSKYRFNWTIPLAFSPQDPHVLYLGAQYLLKTTDSGTSWRAISPDLTRMPAAEGVRGRELGAVYAIAPSSVRGGVIWVGTDDGNIQLTRDGGATWQNVTPPGLSAWSEIRIIEASHTEAGGAYAAVSRRQLDDFKPHIFRTRDFGQTWQETTSGIRDIDFVHVVREDPARKGLLYAGTETGVYVSFDDADHWESLQLNLPAVSVRDLAIEQDDLVAATHGRSFWILDDVTPLRQMADSVAQSEAFLFRPRAAIRIRRDENQNTPLPPEIPAGKNPPDGAILNYFLKAAAGDITLAIYDPDGKLVRSFSSNVPPQAPGPPPFVPSFWIAHPHPPSNAPGMHRFVWDLRYADPPAIHAQSPYNYPISAIAGNTPDQPQGPLVLPGTYEVRLTAGGQTYRHPLEVKMDPRVRFVRNELESQLALELRISEALGRNYPAYEQVKEVRSRLKELAKGSGDPVAAAATALDAKAAALEGGGGGFGAAARGASFSLLDGQLTALIGHVDGADLAPTEQQAQAFEQACKALGGVLQQWEDLKSKELPVFNKLLEEHNAAPLPALPSLPTGDCSR
jgi:photosystem II stability/assembly factor-like uncharacterized protein